LTRSGSSKRQKEEIEAWSLISDLTHNEFRIYTEGTEVKMTTRRITTQEKTHLDQDEQAVPSNITPAVPLSVIAKLLGFTLAMITMPIGTYFFSLNMIFSGNSTWAGATAAAMANVVLIGYVIVAFRDDQSERIAEEQEQSKKSR